MEPTAPKVINVNTIRNQADRQRADADTIADLCDGINTLIAENKKLTEENTELKKQVETLTKK